MHRILSIQSHVVYGYVGNKCASFPMQLLGFEVDNLNSVQLSNHTGYKYFKGQVLNSDQLQELIDGLKLNGLHKTYSHILTGYVGSPCFLSNVAEVVKDMKAASPNLIYVCDPVLGDNGQLYVPKENLQIYVDKLIPMADIMTPNQFEAQWLTGIQIKDVKSAVQTMNWFHDKGVKVIVITSTDVKSSSKSEELTGFASQMVQKDGKVVKEQIQFHIPFLKGRFTGVGDLFTAVSTAWMAKTNQNLIVSCEKALSTLQHVMRRTISAAKNESESNGAPNVRQMELQLVASKKDIEDPEIVIRVEKLDSQ